MPRCDATSASAALRAVRAAASGPPWVPTCTRSITTLSIPQCRTMSPALCATRAESAWSPWSTMTTCTSWPTLGTAQAALATRASESGPPEHPTITGATSMQSTTARRKR